MDTLQDVAEVFWSAQQVKATQACMLIQQSQYFFNNAPTNAAMFRCIHKYKHYFSFFSVDTIVREKNITIFHKSCVPTAKLHSAQETAWMKKKPTTSLTTLIVHMRCECWQVWINQDSTHILVSCVGPKMVCLNAILGNKQKVWNRCGLISSTLTSPAFDSAFPYPLALLYMHENAP